MVGEKEIPFCTIFLVLGAFVSNVLVLIGNLDAASSFTSMGASTGGWSGVGMSMAASFDHELDTLMNKVNLALTHAVSDIDHVQTELDNMLALIGGKTDHSLLQLAKEASHVVAKHGVNASQIPGIPDIPTPLQIAQEAAMAEIKGVVHDEVGKANALLQGFLKAITPALIQIGKWEISFGSKLQSDITMFGTTIDWVQKSFDQLMAKLKGGDNSLEKYMTFNTFNLFDPEANDCITAEDLQGAATMYGITAISGIKGEQVFKKYAGSDGCIDHDEYIAMTGDPGLSGIVTTVLRTYAEGLSKVGGTVGQARLRWEVAASVVNYLDLVSVKNHTKVGWVAERLTNSSVPMAFTACVLRQLALNSMDPNIFSTINTGQFVIEKLLSLNTPYTVKTFEMMSQPSFWYTEGFLDDSLVEVVKIVGHWIEVGINVTRTQEKEEAAERKKEQEEAAEQSKEKEEATKKTTKGASLLEQDAESSALANADALFKSGHIARLTTSAVAEMKKRKQESHLSLIERRESLHEAHTSKHLFRELLGGKTMSKGTMTPAEWQCLHSGVPAVPATLEFAKFLSWNCTLDASIYLHACFDYSSTSSNQLDAFANEIKNFVGKTQSFLSTVSAYSGKPGIEFLEAEIMNFVEGAENALISAIEPKVAGIVKAVIAKAQKMGLPTDPDALMNEIKKELEDLITGGGSMAMVQLQDLPGDVDKIKDASGAIHLGSASLMVFEEINTLMGDLMALLPSAATTVSDARGEVGQVAQMMNSIFKTFSVKGPEIFNLISLAYSALWTVYFVLLLPLTVGTLWYGMWASGWMGGPAAADWPEESEEEAARPKTFVDRLCTCYNACCICCGKCHDSLMCFWSCMIIYQIIVLVIFIVAIVLCMLNGIKLFFTSSCAQIYMLDQTDMCTNVLMSVKSFITTFTVDPLIPIEETCNSKSLLMCDLIGQKMQTSMLYTTIFSFASAIFQYQLVIESAILHERARMRRIVQQLQKTS